MHTGSVARVTTTTSSLKKVVDLPTIWLASHRLLYSTTVPPSSNTVRTVLRSSAKYMYRGRVMQPTLSISHREAILHIRSRILHSRVSPRV